MMFDLETLKNRLENIDVGGGTKYIFWEVEVREATESGHTPTLELTSEGFKMVFDAAGTVWFEIFKKNDGTHGGDQYRRRRADSQHSGDVAFVQDQYAARIIYNIVVDYLLAQ